MAVSDKDTALPIRSEADGSDERVHSKIVGSPTGVSPATNMAAVDDDKNVHVEMHGNDPAGDDQILRLSEGGALTPDGVYVALTNTKPGNVGVITSTRATAPSDSTQSFRVTGVQGTVNDQVHAMDVALHDESGNPYSDTNPIPVTVLNDEGGDEIKSYKESTIDLVRHGNETQAYTVTAAHTLRLNKVMVSASGKIKAVLKVAGTVVAVKFNSTADTNIEFSFNRSISVAAAAKVEVVITNLDYQAFGVYSTILGLEVVV